MKCPECGTELKRKEIDPVTTELLGTGGVLYCPKCDYHDAFGWDEQERIEIETKIKFSDSEGAIYISIEPSFWEKIPYVYSSPGYEHRLDILLDHLKDAIGEVVKKRFEEREKLQRKIEEIIYSGGWVQGKPNTTVQGMAEQIMSLFTEDAKDKKSNNRPCC